MKKKLEQEIRVDDDLEHGIEEQIPENKEIMDRLRQEQAINEELEKKIDREELLDVELKTDEQIEKHKGELERFFVKRDLKAAKEEKRQLSIQVSELIAKREALEKELQQKILDKLKREGRILKDAEERDDLEG